MKASASINYVCVIVVCAMLSNGCGQPVRLDNKIMNFTSDPIKYKGVNIIPGESPVPVIDNDEDWYYGYYNIEY